MEEITQMNDIDTRKCSRIAFLILLIIVIVLGSACSRSREGTLYGFGSITVIIFLLLSAQAYLVHLVHGQKWFQDFRIKARKILLPISIIGAIAGVIISINGFFLEDLDRLYKFIGLECAALFFFLRLWCGSDNVDEQRISMRLVALCFTALSVLAYLLMDAPGIKG